MKNSCDFPNDLLADILFRLPSATVLRFKLVSKTWYDLISDPLFIKLHSKRLSLNPKILLSLNLKVHSEFRIFDYESPSFKATGPLIFPRETSDFTPFKVIGSSFGLVCVATNNCGSFYLWNPTTRESTKIPNFGRRCIDHHDYLHGLGYDSVSNDFKVVISMYPVKYVAKLSITYHVYSSKMNSWKSIVYPFQYYYNPCKFPTEWKVSTCPTKTPSATTLAVVLNGVFHWLVRVPNELDPHVIAFDSSRETFQKLQIPKEKEGKLQFPATLEKACGIVSLLEHKGMLCLFCSMNERWDEKEIWVMKEYGNYKSWTHLLDVFYSARNLCSGFIYKPLCITSKNEVVFHTDGRLTRWSSGKLSYPCRFIYQDYQYEQEKNTGQFWAEPGYIFGATLVDETLVSPMDIITRKSNYFSCVLDLFVLSINCLFNYEVISCMDFI